jgi:hypothetical protein
MTQPELIKLGAPKMEGQFQASGSYPISLKRKKRKKNLLKLSMFYFSELDPLDYVETRTALR